MAYKQQPGRSPLLKTGRDIPLNMTSPLNQQGWFSRLGSEIEKRGAKDVLKTTIGNVGGYIKSIGRRAKIVDYEMADGGTRGIGNTYSTEKKYQQTHGGDKDIFMPGRNS